MDNLGLEIAFESKQHGEILMAAQARYDMSYRQMAQHWDRWKKADELFQFYVKKTDEDTIRKAKRDTDGVPQYVTLHIPYSYSILLAVHTYWSSVFLGRSPIFQFTGRHGESQQKVQAMEAVIDYQTSVGGMTVPMYQWLLDGGKYGFGVIGEYWAEETTRVTKILEEPKKFLGMDIPGTSHKVKKTLIIPGYSGNKIFNVRPYDFFPDPRVPLLRFQEGEFCGRTTQVGWNTILKKAAQGEYFNIEALRKARNPARDSSQDSSVQILPADNESLHGFSYGSNDYVNLLEMTIELIPKEWKFGNSMMPEKWVITVGNKSVVIGCRPLGAYHNRFPFEIQSYEIEGYAHAARGIPEISRELQKAMEWLFNSHFFNVRKSLNDQLVVDPSRLVMKDLTDGGPGKIIRLRSNAYGQDVRTIINQLQVQDITAGHLGDAQIVAELIQRATGANDNIMGMLNPRGRKTATEVRTSSTMGINRLKTLSEFNSALGWTPLAQVLVQNTQQYYDGQKQFRIAGDLIEPGMRFLDVSPEDIAGFYDYVPVDGTLPIDRFAQATLWKEIILGLEKVPMIANQYDIGRIFAWMAQIAGLKNISQFKLQVSPDQALLNAAATGQATPAQLPPPAAGTSPAVGGSSSPMMMGNNFMGNNQESTGVM